MKSFNRKYNSLLEQITNYLIERGLINDISTDFSRNLIKRSFLLAFLTLIRSQLNPVKLSLEDYSCLFSNKKGHSSLKNKNELSIVIETLLPFDWGLTNVIEQQDKEFIQKKLKEFIDTFNWQPIHPINYDISENIITPEIFETIFNLESSKKRGAVNTPYYLAYWIVKSNFQKLFSNFLGMSNFSLDVLKSLDAESKKVFKDWMVKLKVLDIAVGCGTFFLAAGRYIINLFKYLGLPPVFFAKILYGVDIDKKAIQICRIRLFLLILYSVPSIQLKDLMKIIESSKLKSGNSLIGSVKKSIDRENIESEIEEIMKKSSHLIHFNIFHWYLEFPEIFQRSKEIGFDMVIGNPPFIGYRYISREEKVILRSLYPSIYTGLNDLYYYFILRAMELLNSNGFLALIVSRYFLEARYAAKLRTEIFKSVKIEAIIDFSEYKVFPGVGINTAIIFATKMYDSSSLSHMYILRNYDITLFSLLQELEECVENPEEMAKMAFKSYQFDQTDLANGTSNIVSERAKDILSKMKNQSDPLYKVCDTGTGYHSGNDAVFSKNIVKEDEKFYGENISQNPIIRMPLEHDLIKEIIKTSDILPFVVKWVEKYVILTQRGVNINSYPLTKRYLEQSKEKLINRYEVKKRLAKWYEIAQVRNNELFKAKKKIMCPYRTKVPRFAIDENQRYTSIDCTSIVPKKSSRLNIYYLLGLLNSEMIAFYLYAVSKKLDALKIELYPKTISHIPIKIPKSENEIAISNEITHLTEKIWINLKKKEINNYEKHSLVVYGKEGFRKYTKDSGLLPKLISKLDILVYKLYGFENQIKEIQEEIEILKH